MMTSAAFALLQTHAKNFVHIVLHSESNLKKYAPATYFRLCYPLLYKSSPVLQDNPSEYHKPP